MPEHIGYIHVRGDRGLFAIRRDGSETLLAAADLEAELAAEIVRVGPPLMSVEPEAEEHPALAGLITRLRQMGVIETANPHPSAVLQGGLTTLMVASANNQVDVVADLIRRGASVDAHDASGYDALMYASHFGETPTIRLLIGAGADVNASDNRGSTPVMFAAQGGHLEAAQVLIDAGASIARRGRHGYTAVDFATQNQRWEVLRMFATYPHRSRDRD